MCWSGSGLLLLVRHKCSCRPNPPTERYGAIALGHLMLLNVADALSNVTSVLVRRPAAMLVLAIMLLGLLATVATVRAGLQISDELPATARNCPTLTNDAMDWGMPYWVSIHQAGSTEGGFHALLRVKNGGVTPTSMLGRPYTNGCIMLSDEDEKTVYDWATLATLVWIHY